MIIDREQRLLLLLLHVSESLTDRMKFFVGMVVYV